MKLRSIEPELIDLGNSYYSSDEYNNCLYQLGKIGKYLGANYKMIKAFSSLDYDINSILDVGCGGGYFTKQLDLKFKNAQVTGIDLNIDAIKHAQENNTQPNNIKFLTSNTPELNEEAKSYDIVTATLVCHHLSDEQIIDFLKRAKLVARKNIIINDLHRSPISYYFAKIIIPIFFANRLVKNDSLLSIRKSFTKDDWVYYCKMAQIEPSNYSIKWHWHFRWIIKIDIN